MTETQLKQAIEKCNNDINYYKGEAEKCQNDINFYKGEISKRENDLYFFADKQAVLTAELDELNRQLKELQSAPKGQLLYMPIHNSRITSGYKNSNYKKQFGFNHYGADLTDKNRSDYSVYGMGKGTVLAAGKDSKTGWTLVIRYNQVALADGTVKDIIIRMWHFDKILVKKGDNITRDTLIAYYGDTGTYASGKHLHIEIDKDVQYPAYSPSFSGNTTIIKAGTDSTINPTQVLNVRTNQVNPQTLVGSTTSDCWTSADLNYRKC